MHKPSVFKSYFSHHGCVAKESLLKLLHTPIASLLTWLAIGVAMALPAGLFVGLSAIIALNEHWDGAAQISLFIDRQRGGDIAEQQLLVEQLAARDDIAAVDYTSAEQALEEFQSLSGYSDVLQYLDDNPLPAVIVVHPQHDAVEAVVQLYDTLAMMPQVDQAVLDLEWLQRLHRIVELGERLAIILSILLALLVLLMVGNTVRLAIESRRDEIVIIKLLGGSKAFVRRPLLYTGLWYGLGGALLAWCIVSLGVYWISEPISALANLYHSTFTLHGLTVLDTLLLWLSGALLGLLGAWLAVGRHLGMIEPR